MERRIVAWIFCVLQTESLYGFDLVVRRTKFEEIMPVDEFFAQQRDKSSRFRCGARSFS